MRARVSGRIAPSRALMKLETLIGETPAAIATSRRVTCPPSDLARSELNAACFTFAVAAPDFEARLDPDRRLSLDFIELRLLTTLFPPRRLRNSGRAPYMPHARICRSMQGRSPPVFPSADNSF